mmetsp:Transcript_14018/g.32596  ORF Transcript_14018/g.32596 Transcript_14018/m.32596 type:complete len:202 (-) Transcript_14018:830-1435(-)
MIVLGVGEVVGLMKSSSSCEKEIDFVGEMEGDDRGRIGTGKLAIRIVGFIVGIEVGKSFLVGWIVGVGFLSTSGNMIASGVGEVVGSMKSSSSCEKIVNFVGEAEGDDCGGTNGGSIADPIGISGSPSFRTKLGSRLCIGVSSVLESGVGANVIASGFPLKFVGSNPGTAFGSETAKSSFCHDDDDDDEADADADFSDLTR